MSGRLTIRSRVTIPTAGRMRRSEYFGMAVSAVPVVADGDAGNAADAVAGREAVVVGALGQVAYRHDAGEFGVHLSGAEVYQVSD